MTSRLFAVWGHGAVAGASRTYGPADLEKMGASVALSSHADPSKLRVRVV